MICEVTKQTFEFFLEEHCDNTIFSVRKTENAIFYTWKKDGEAIASQTIEYGKIRRIYEVKVSL